MPPEVSIIVPVHNGEAYLAAALDSVLAQSLADWELIVVDDGSSDGTLDVLARYSHEPRLVVLEQPNGGTARARNRGLEHARGELVAFLDADDMWRPEYLARMAGALRQAPAASAAYSGWQYIDQAGTPLPQRVMPYGGDSALLARELHWKVALVPAAVVARRAAVAACGGFDAALRTAEDWDLWLRMAPRGAFVAVPGYATLYRQHAHSKTGQTERAEQGRLTIVQKHFGRMEGSPEQWPLVLQQATANIYLASALAYWRQHNHAAAIEKSKLAIACWPGLLERSELYYELGAAFQERGWRGSPAGLRLAESTAMVHQLLHEEWAIPQARRRALWGYACLVLAQLAQHTGQTAGARRLALRALVYAALPHKARAARSLLRACLPAGLVRALGRARPDHAGER